MTFPSRPLRLPPVEEDWQSILDLTAANMLAFGWALTGVLAHPASGSRGFVHTIGFTTALGVPEVVIVGLPPELASTLLNDLGKRLQRMTPCERTCAVAESTRMSNLLANGLEVTFRSLGTYADAGHLNSAADTLGRGDFAVLQLLWPDSDNRLPVNPDCDPRVEATQVWPPYES